ncbi:MAG: hypothetical protein ACREAU_06085 [Nitrosopumilaceae archaeon]
MAPKVKKHEKGLAQMSIEQLEKALINVRPRAVKKIRDELAKKSAKKVIEPIVEGVEEQIQETFTLPPKFLQ